MIHQSFCAELRSVIGRSVHEGHKYELVGTMILISLSESFFPADKDNQCQILINIVDPILGCLSV